MQHSVNLFDTACGFCKGNRHHVKQKRCIVTFKYCITGIHRRLSYIVKLITLYTDIFYFWVARNFTAIQKKVIHFVASSKFILLCEDFDLKFILGNVQNIRYPKIIIWHITFVALSSKRIKKTAHTNAICIRVSVYVIALTIYTHTSMVPKHKQRFKNKKKKTQKPYIHSQWKKNYFQTFFLFFYLCIDILKFMNIQILKS